MATTARDRFLTEFPAALDDDAGALFVGAGVSQAAGYPSWNGLLHDIGEELGVSSNDVQDLAALAQWSIESSGNRSRIQRVIRDEIAPDHPIPESLKIIARLPTRHIWTTNYDRLVERAFAEIRRPLDVISAAADLASRPRPGAARLYKMHGSVDRLNDLVISTDDYELFRTRRGAFLPLLQAQLTSMSMLFVGLSFADPNVRHVLALIRESFTDSPPEHFALLRPPHREEFSSDAEYEARAAQHQLWARDLRRYGLYAVEIETFDEIPGLLKEIELRVARRRVWISGSWPPGHPGTEKAYEVASAIGCTIADLGLSLVTGAGQVVGPASIAGFLDTLRETGTWDLERRLVARPFPQPLSDRAIPADQWRALREELARLAGTLVVVGGAKLEDGHLVEASGVAEEVQLAQAAGSFLLPIGATGGAARRLANELRGSSIGLRRPNDDELTALADEGKNASQLADIVRAILKRNLGL